MSHLFEVDMPAIDLGTYIRETLSKAGLSISEAATGAGMSKSGLHNILMNKIQQPFPATLERLARYLAGDGPEGRLAYAKYMGWAGYLGFFPEEIQAAARALGVPIAQQGVPTDELDRAAAQLIEDYSDKATDELRIVLERLKEEDPEFLREHLRERLAERERMRRTQGHQG
jgi:transcriptional regulator with XRE-family HTH domain